MEFGTVRMETKDKLIAALGWVFWIAALVGYLIRPPLHPVARQHCQYALIFHLAVTVAYFVVRVMGWWALWSLLAIGVLVVIVLQIVRVISEQPPLAPGVTTMS